MRQRTVLLIVTGVGLAASCAGTAMVRPDEAAPRGTTDTADRHSDAPRITPTGVTLTPVIVHAGGRMTPQPETGSTTTMGERAALEEAEGEATYYASMLEGRRTASGIVFRNAEAYAAHRTWPFGTVVRVTSLVNGRSAVVRIVDRGPHGNSARARRTVIDVSQSTARALDFMRDGRIPVRVEVLEWGSGRR